MPPPAPWQAAKTRISTAGSFAYTRHHQPTPLPASALAMLTSTQVLDAGDASPFDVAQPPIDVGPALPVPTQGGLCSTIAAVARANDLPVTFFANLIWQESSFRSRSISSAGALGIAQFTPETATERGLLNPFEPIHALFAAGKLLHRLHARFGNLGLAAAAYNAGPQRIANWVAEHGPLPPETRDYVMKITGRPAGEWLSSEVRHDPSTALMPPRAPCAEVVQEVREQTKIVRVARLMQELAKATAPPDDGGKATLAAWSKIKARTMQLAVREFSRIAEDTTVRPRERLARTGAPTQFLR